MRSLRIHWPLLALTMVACGPRPYVATPASGTGDVGYCAVLTATDLNGVAIAEPTARPTKTSRAGERAKATITGRPTETPRAGGQGGTTIAAQPAATIVIVFASWCQPCRDELAMLGELRHELSDIRIVGVNAYEEYADRSDETRLREFLADAAPWLRVVRADEPMLRALGGVPKVPTMFVYDHQGGLIAAFRRSERRPPSRQELLDTLVAAGR